MRDGIVFSNDEFNSTSHQTLFNSPNSGENDLDFKFIRGLKHKCSSLYIERVLVSKIAASILSLLKKCERTNKKRFKGPLLAFYNFRKRTSRQFFGLRLCK